MTTHSIFLFAGEISGDIHGEKLFRSLREKYPAARIFGVGGPLMRQAGLECILPMENFQVMGFIDVLFALPKLIRQFFFLRRLLLKEKPDILLFIDYPGFNLALAKSLTKRSFQGKICQYICPSVWAWGKKRIFKMEKILDYLFVIFPFEKELFDPKKLNVTYVGNPLVQTIRSNKTPPLELEPDKRIIALFPGSRQKEVFRNFPLQLKVAKKLLEKFPDLYFVVSVATPSFSLLLEEIMQREGFPAKQQILFLESAQNVALMKRCYLAIAKSGTNNLELALHGVPTIVTYGVGALDLFIAQKILKINLPFYCIVNIIAGKQVYPELIGPHFTEEKLFEEANRFLTSKKIWEECREKCREMSKILKDKAPEQEITELLFNR